MAYALVGSENNGVDCANRGSVFRQFIQQWKNGLFARMRDVHSSKASLFDLIQQSWQGFDANAELFQINQLIRACEARCARFFFVQTWRARRLNACADQTDFDELVA